MMGVEFFIGRRYLRAKQKQAFISLITYLSVAGVTVGVMTLIVVLAVMTGMEGAMKSQILNAVESHIDLQSLSPFADYRKAAETIEKLPGVEGATPYLSFQGMLRSSAKATAVIIKGVDPSSVNRVIPYLKPESLATQDAVHQQDPSQAPGIILGRKMAEYLGVTAGDWVQLISLRGPLSPIGYMPAVKKYQVVDLYKSGMDEYDRAFAFISLPSAQGLSNKKDEVTGLAIRVTDIYNADRTGDAAVSALGGLPYYADTWMSVYGNLFFALKLEKTAMFIILALIVMVAAFNIAGSLIMMVMEKKKDIAILHAMGATRRQIRRIFVFKGMVIGFIGTVLGGGLGWLLCTLLDRYQFIKLPKGVYYIDTLPVDLQMVDVLAISLAALAICFVATLYPANQASKMNPVEAIRNG